MQLQTLRDSCPQFITGNKKLFLTTTRVLEKSDKILPKAQGAGGKISQPALLTNAYFSLEKQLRDSKEVYHKKARSAVGQMERITGTLVKYSRHCHSANMPLRCVFRKELRIYRTTE